jgi:hypothetical protein
MILNMIIPSTCFMVISFDIKLKHLKENNRGTNKITLKLIVLHWGNEKHNENYVEVLRKYVCPCSFHYEKLSS